MSWGWDELPETHFEPDAAARAEGYEVLRNTKNLKFFKSDKKTARTNSRQRIIRGRNRLPMPGDEQ